MLKFCNYNQLLIYIQAISYVINKAINIMIVENKNPAKKTGIFVNI